MPRRSVKPEVQFVAKDSLRIGRDCCPACGSTHLRYRRTIVKWHCGRCGEYCGTPAKVKATVVERYVRPDEQMQVIEIAGPVHYRGLRWGGEANF